MEEEGSHFAAALVADDERGGSGSDLLLDLFMPGEGHGNLKINEWRRGGGEGEEAVERKEEEDREVVKRGLTTK